MKYTANAFSLPSSDGIHTLAAWCWSPEAPVGVIQLSHGMCEYVLRYTSFAERMCDAGFAVVGHDHLGHGYTARSADELGYITDAKDPAMCLVKDIYTINGWIKQTFPDLPVILYGHSMLLRKLLCLIVVHLTVSAESEIIVDCRVNRQNKKDII